MIHFNIKNNFFRIHRNMFRIKKLFLILKYIYIYIFIKDKIIGMILDERNSVNIKEKKLKLTNLCVDNSTYNKS